MPVMTDSRRAHTTTVAMTIRLGVAHMGSSLFQVAEKRIYQMSEAAANWAEVQEDV